MLNVRRRLRVQCSLLPLTTRILVDSGHLCGSTMFFFNDTATTEIYSLSLHDALPISPTRRLESTSSCGLCASIPLCWSERKSTRLNSSHSQIPYAGFCLKKNQYQANPPPSALGPHTGRSHGGKSRLQP